MAGKHHALGAGDVLAQPGEQCGDLGRRGVTHGVRRIQRGRAGGHRGGEDLGEELALGAQCVLGGELHFVAQTDRALDRGDRGVEHLRLAHAELVLAMQRAGGKEQVDARAARLFQRPCGGVDVARQAAREAAHGGVHQRARDLGDGGEVIRRGLRKTGFEHVDAERLQRLRHAQLGAAVEREAGRLFAVAQGGVEDAYVRFAGRCVALRGFRGVVRGHRRGLRRCVARGQQKTPRHLWCGVLRESSGLSLSYLDTRPQPAPPLVISTSTRARSCVPRSRTRPMNAVWRLISAMWRWLVRCGMASTLTASMVAVNRRREKF